MKKMDLYCLNCGKLYNYKFKLHCDVCDGAIEIKYDLSKAKIGNSDNPLKKYFDLLPIPSMEFAHHLKEGNTPLYHAKELGKFIGLSNLYLKLEGENPTNTTKDRMASVSLSYLKAVGVNNFVTSSTGNSSTSYGYYVSHFGGFNIDIFMGIDFIHNYRNSDNKNITLYMIDGTFVDAGRVAKNFAEKSGKVNEGGFFNIGRREGLKIAILEAYDQLNGDFDFLFQSVSSAMGILGSFKGIDEYITLGKATHQPKIICCQQETNSPMVNAFQAGSPHIRKQDIVNNPHGLAQAILRGDPTKIYPYIRNIVLKTNGSMEKSSLKDILEAINVVKELEGLEIGYTAGVSVACMMNMIKQKRIDKEDKVLINVTDGVNKLLPVRPTWKFYENKT